MMRVLALFLLSLAVNGMAADWPRFLGPNDDGSSPETGFPKAWPEGGPKKLWEAPKGGGYACPVVAGEWCVVFSRDGENEVIEGLNAATGERKWKVAYEAPYQPQYGDSDGTRSNPTISEGRVYVEGVGGQLHCLELATGRIVWKRELANDYKLSPTFFGRGGSPLVSGGRLIVSLGTEDGQSLMALDPATGKERWTAKSPWGASYASPMPAKFYGKDCILAFQGGMDRPPTGGLLLVDAADGRVLDSVSHRAKIWASVSIASPVVAGNRVFISEAYTEGGLCAEVTPEFKLKTAWRSPDFATYFSTAVQHDGLLFGCAGQEQRTAALTCLDMATGKELWHDELGGKFQRGSLLRVDGAYLCLGENGDLAWLDLSAKGAKVLAQARLFNAPETWTLPALSNGRLYVTQNLPGAGGTKPRVICYDLRGEQKK